MAKPPATNQQVAQHMDVFKAELAARANMLRSMLPATVPLEKFQTAVITAIGSNPSLLTECSRPSLFKACVEAAELGLSLNPALKECDILPVWNNRTKRKDAQFRPRYMGYMKLARQSGEILSIEAHAVRANDVFEYEYGLNKKLVHVPARDNPGDLVAAYCIWKLSNGETQFEVMSGGQIEKIKSRSSAKNQQGDVVGPWETDTEEMWRKTVVRRASKYMPMAAEFAKAVAVDNLREDGQSVSIEGGELIVDAEDITEPSDQPQNMPPQAAKGLDNLEQRVAPQTAKAPTIDATAQATPKPRTEPPKIPFLPVPRGENGSQNYTAWANAAAAQLTGKDAAFKKQWRVLHQEILGEMEFADGEALAKVMGALG